MDSCIDVSYLVDYSMVLIGLTQSCIIEILLVDLSILINESLNDVHGIFWSICCCTNSKMVSFTNFDS